MKRLLIGKVSVDSGQLLVADPCYLRDWDGARVSIGGDGKLDLPSDPFPFSYSGACAATFSEPAGMLKFENFGAAAAISTGGDGRFPVFLETDDRGDRRIVINLY